MGGERSELKVVFVFCFREVIIQSNSIMFYSTLHMGSLWETPSFQVLGGITKRMALLPSIPRLAVLFSEFINKGLVACLLKWSG